jgi:hypothetical protein
LKPLARFRHCTAVQSGSAQLRRSTTGVRGRAAAFVGAHGAHPPADAQVDAHVPVPAPHAWHVGQLAVLQHTPLTQLLLKQLPPTEHVSPRFSLTHEPVASHTLDTARVSARRAAAPDGLTRCSGSCLRRASGC